jgi:alpha-D-ribose 1-methylphosphonate 5-triphosphate diphosphatase
MIHEPAGRPEGAHGSHPLSDTVITNALIVLAHDLVRGSAHLVNGRIVAVDSGPCGLPAALDFDGDLLLPGLVDLHTDNLERHAMPRPGVSFPMRQAVQAHDAEIAAAGITTVFDAVGAGDPYDAGFRSQDQGELLAMLDLLDDAGVLKVQHHVHLRCELPAPNARELFQSFARHRRLRLMSLMDHTPGQRQWVDLEQARRHHVGKKGWSEARFEEELRLAPERQARHAAGNRRWFADFARTHGIPLATHDDATPAHIDEALAAGATLAEFPTTLQAARHAQARGLATVAGAPNIVRGGSHAGNVAALTLAKEGVLDMLSSDYVPASLLQAAWQLHAQAGFSVPEAIALVSRRPARAAGLADRGDIAPGQRADLLRVRLVAGEPVVREVRVAGHRVA